MNLKQYRKAFVAVSGAVVAVALLWGVDLSAEAEKALVTFDLAATVFGVWYAENDPPDAIA